MGRRARFLKGCTEEQLVGKSLNLRAPSPQSAHTGGRSASLAIVDGLNEFQRRGELHPPVALLPTQPTGVEIIDVLNSGQQAGRVCLEGRRRRDGPTLTAGISSCNGGAHGAAQTRRRMIGGGGFRLAALKNSSSVGVLPRSP